MPRPLNMLRQMLMCSASVAVLDYAELKARIAVMEQISKGEFHYAATS